MPEPTNTLDPIQSATPTDSTAPVMPDPQKLVDEALSPTAPAPATPAAPVEPAPTLTPTPAPIEEEKEPLKQEETVPPELLNPTSSSDTTSTPLTPTIPEPTPTPAMPEINTPPAMTESTPTIETPVEAKPSTGEEVPLAFASAAPTESMPTPSITSTPTKEEPAVTVTPTSMTPPKPEKKKRKGGKVLGVIAGFLLLVSSVWGAYWYYKHYLEVQPEIAAVKGKTKQSCSGCSNGGWLTWRNGECKRVGICGNDNENKNTQNPANKDLTTQSGCEGAGQGYVWCSSVDSTGKKYAFCGTAGKGCNQEAQDRGYSIVYGATPGKGNCDADKVAAGLQTGCTCGTQAYCFNRHGSCNSTVITRSDGSQVDTGLCGLVGSIPKGSTTFQEYKDLFCTQADVDNKVGGCTRVDQLKYDYYCDLNGCSTSDAACVTVHYTCKGSTTGNNSCTTASAGYIGDRNNPQTGTSQTFSNKCGTVEQIDVMCGTYKMSRTKINGDCSNETTTTNENPTLACSSLTKDKADTDIKVGTTVKFTCTGTSTPAGAVNLTYKFQIQKDAGAWTDLTATANTATYEVAAVGTYNARCKACGTINNASVCDPDWTGATTQ